MIGGINRRDWREIGLDDIATDAREVDRALLAMLRDPARPSRAHLDDWTRDLVAETRELMRAVLPLRDREVEFLERLNARGQIVPELLTDDPVLQETVRAQPGLEWKALHVRRHTGS